MVLLLLHLALTHVRNAELLGIIGPLLIAAPSRAAAVPGADRAPSAASGAPRGFAPAPLAAAGLVTIVIALGVLSTAVALDRRGIRPRENVAPAAAVDAARAAGLDGHVLNSIRFGGYLMFAGIPIVDAEGRCGVRARNARRKASLGRRRRWECRRTSDNAETDRVEDVAVEPRRAGGVHGGCRRDILAKGGCRADRARPRSTGRPAAITIVTSPAAASGAGANPLGAPLAAERRPVCAGDRSCARAEPRSAVGR